MSVHVCACVSELVIKPVNTCFACIHVKTSKSFFLLYCIARNFGRCKFLHKWP